MASARYWRVIFSTGNGADIWLSELEFIDANNAPISPSGATVIKSDEYSAAYGAALAFDGKKGTENNGWASAVGQWPAWIGLDFGAAREVAGATIYISPVSGAYDELPVPGAVSMQYSSDGSTWTDAGLYVGGTFAVGGILYVFSLAAITTPVSRGALAFSSPVPGFETAADRGVMARDMEFGGRGSITGQTLVKDGGPEVPTRARVRLLRARDGLLAREAWSDPSTGAYSFASLDTAQQFIALAQKPDGSYEPVAGGPLTPQVP